MRDKYLPIGSIVILNGSDKKLMITGFCPVDIENDMKYDYCGCLYPTGIIETDKIALFNHDQINEIEFIGFIDTDEIKFKKELNELMNN